MNKLALHSNGAIVDAEGKLIVRLVYADDDLKRAIFRYVEEYMEVLQPEEATRDEEQQ